MGLALLPSERIMEAYQSLMEKQFELERSAVRNLNKFKRYVGRQWIIGQDLNQISVFAQSVATNNGCESFNAQLKKAIKIHNPNPWTFVYLLNDIIADKSRDFRNFSENPNDYNPRKAKTVRHLERRRNAELDLSENRITILQFLTRVSFGFKSQISRMQKRFLRRRGRLANADAEISDSSSSEGNSSDDEPNVPVVVQRRPNCVICLEERYPSYILLPCFHNVLCENCSSQIMQGFGANGRRCPVCREPVESRHRTFD